MLRKVLISAIAMGAMAVSVPAAAGGNKSSSGGCYFSCGGGSTSGWNKPRKPRYPSGSNGGSSSSGGTQVPEPGMLGLAGAGLMGLGFIRLRRRKRNQK